MKTDVLYKVSLDFSPQGLISSKTSTVATSYLLNLTWCYRFQFLHKYQWEWNTTPYLGHCWVNVSIFLTYIAFNRIEIVGGGWVGLFVYWFVCLVGWFVADIVWSQDSKREIVQPKSWDVKSDKASLNPTFFTLPAIQAWANSLISPSLRFLTYKMD